MDYDHDDSTLTNPTMDPAGPSAIVYVREADPEALPDHLKGAPGKIFSVHNPEGTCLALTDDRRIAFELAKRNDMVPVSVH
ncbi:MAG: DUF1150 family protein [Pseudomonadota bacterium]